MTMHDPDLPRAAFRRGDVFRLFLFLFRILDVLFQDEVDVGGQRTVVFLGFLPQLRQQIRIHGNTDFLFQRFHSYITSAVL